MPVLRAVADVATTTAVAQAPVEPAVGAELEMAAVVVVVGLVDRQPRVGAAGVGQVGVGAHVVADEARIAGLVGEVDVEAAARRVVRREGQSEQPLLRIDRHASAQVQERAPVGAVAVEDPDAAFLLDDEQARVAGRRDQADGMDKVVDRQLRRDLGDGRRPCPARRQDEQGGDQRRAGPPRGLGPDGSRWPQQPDRSGHEAPPRLETDGRSRGLDIPLE